MRTYVTTTLRSFWNVLALGWELMGHNLTNTQPLNTLPSEEERGVIGATLDRIASALGKRPRGWLGSGLQETWNTLDYLVEEGVAYVADWVNDDQPYCMMAIALHPYLSGVPHRIHQILDEALAYICAQKGVWRTTGSEIFEAFLEPGRRAQLTTGWSPVHRSAIRAS